MIDVTLASPNEGATPAALDYRKEHWLRSRLARFPLRAHWLVETACGFQALLRVRPARAREAVADALRLQARLNAVTGGRADAGVLQAFRLPGTLHHFGTAPAVVRLLEDHAAAVAPYGPEELAAAIDACPLPTPRP